MIVIVSTPLGSLSADRGLIVMIASGIPFKGIRCAGVGVLLHGGVRERDAVDHDRRRVDVGYRHEVGRGGRRAEDIDLQVCRGGCVDVERRRTADRRRSER